MEKENCLNSVVYPLSKKFEVIQWIVLSIFIFLVPMIIPTLFNNIFGKTSWIATHSQYFVGTIVNTVLITAAINVKGFKQIAGLITLPSISAISSGLIFKSASIFTVYMIPAIWAGNFLFVYLYRKLLVQNKVNYILSSIASILAKVAVIYLCFRLLALIINIPEPMFTALNLSMGLNQLISATIASVIGFGISKIYSNKTRAKDIKQA